MDETNERVTTIEDHVDMPHTKENSFHFQQELLRFLTSYAGHFFRLLNKSKLSHHACIHQPISERE